MDIVKKYFLIFAIGSFFCAEAKCQDLSSLGTGLPQIFIFIKKMCGESPSFSADATVEMIESGATNPLAIMPSKFIFFGNNARWDLNAGQMSGSIMSPEAAAALKTSKLDKMSFVTKLDKGTGFIIFPSVRAYVNFPIPEAEISQSLQTAESIRLQAEIIGKETLDGYRCTKSRITVPSEANLHQEAFVWTAPELRNYPVKLQVVTPNGTMVFHFQNLKFEPPPASDFEVATDFVRKASSKEILDLAGHQPTRAAGSDSTSVAEGGIKAAILHYGITSLGNGVSQADSSDPTGKHFYLTSPTVVKTETNCIPAKLGTAFGCFCEISGLPERQGDRIEVEILWKYPAMTKPDGSTSDGFAYTEPRMVNADGCARWWVGYRFENQYELVRGEWQLELRYEGRTLVAQNFSVY